MDESIRSILNRVENNLNKLITPQIVKKLTPLERILEELQELFNFALRHAESIKLEVHSITFNNFRGYEGLEYVNDMIHEFSKVDDIKILPENIVFINDLNEPININFEYYLAEPFEDIAEQYGVSSEKIETDFIELIKNKEDIDNYNLENEVIVLPKECVKKEDLETWHRFQRVETKYISKDPDLTTRFNFNLSMTIEEFNFSINGAKIRIILNGNTFENLDNLKYLREYVEWEEIG